MFRRTLRKAYWTALEASPPPLAARLSYLRAHGRLPNLAKPHRFTERVFAVKLRGGHDAFVDLADKVRVKDHVAAHLGASFVVPTIWSGPALPPRAERAWPLPFVLKANHGSGMNALVRSEADLDWDGLEAKAAWWLRKDWPAWMCEDWYNRIPRQLLVEPLLGDGEGDLPDYKVSVFGGRARFVQVDADRFGRRTQSFHDRDWGRLPFRRGFPPPAEPPPPPLHLREILDAAETLSSGLLSAGIDFVRVDFYDLPDGPKFGEMTFTPNAGLIGFTPDRYDFEWGRFWEEGRAAAGDTNWQLGKGEALRT